MLPKIITRTLEFVPHTYLVKTKNQGTKSGSMELLKEPLLKSVHPRRLQLRAWVAAPGHLIHPARL